MICYTLVCSDGHSFEAWFRDSESCRKDLRARRVSCPICGDGKVSKALMAPGLATGLRAAGRADEPSAAGVPGPQAQTDVARLESMLGTLRKRVEASATDVGRRFPEEARQMHEGVIERKPIYGEASLAEARELRAEGVPCMPLPWQTRRTN